MDYPIFPHLMWSLFRSLVFAFRVFLFDPGSVLPLDLYPHTIGRGSTNRNHYDAWCVSNSLKNARELAVWKSQEPEMNHLVPFSDQSTIAMHCQISTRWVALLLIIYTERLKRVSRQIIFSSTSDSGSALRKRGSCRLLRLLCLPEHKFQGVVSEIGCATGCNCVKQDQRRVRSQVVEREMNGNRHSHQPLHQTSPFSWTLQCIGFLKSIWIYSM